MTNEELNILVAEKVMGWSYSTTEEYAWFQPTTSISDAWRVLDDVCKQHDWRAIVERNQNQTEVNFQTQMGGNLAHYGIAESSTVAICLAALETVGIQLEFTEEGTIIEKPFVKAGAIEMAKSVKKENFDICRKNGWVINEFEAHIELWNKKDELLKVVYNHDSLNFQLKSMIGSLSKRKH